MPVSDLILESPFYFVGAEIGIFAGLAIFLLGIFNKKKRYALLGSLLFCAFTVLFIYLLTYEPAKESGTHPHSGHSHDMKMHIIIL